MTTRKHRNRKLIRKYRQIAKALYPTFQLYYCSKDYSYTIDTLPEITSVHFICRHIFKCLTVLDSTNAVSWLTSDKHISIQEYNAEFAHYISHYDMVMQP